MLFCRYDSCAFYHKLFTFIPLKYMKKIIATACVFIFSILLNAQEKVYTEVLKQLLW